VRELENALERAVVLASEPRLLPVHFPTLRRSVVEPQSGSAALGVRIPGSTLAELEREAILRTLEAVGGSTSRAAALLDISARKVQYKVREYQQQAQAVASQRG